MRASELITSVYLRITRDVVFLLNDSSFISFDDPFDLDDPIDFNDSLDLGDDSLDTFLLFDLLF